MFTVISRVGLIVGLIAMGTAAAAPAPGTQPTATQPAVTAANAPASQPGLLKIEPQPGAGRITDMDFQGLGNIHVPAEKPAIAKSDKAVMWHDSKTRYKSALLFDESGGTGTGYDTLYVSLEGNETFTGEVATYKPAKTDVSPEAPGRNFEMDFEKVTIAQVSNRPNIAAKITFRGNRNQDDPQSQYSFGGRLYPPVPSRRWAVGSFVIDGKTVRAAILDENGNGRFDDRGGLNPQNPESPRVSDVLLLAMEEGAELNPQIYGGADPRYAQRVPLPEYLVLNAGTFQVKIEQAEDTVSVRLVPAEVPAATVELSENRRQENLTLTGTKTCVILTDVPNKILLPADTYASPYSGESPYEVEAEEGVTMGLPFPKARETAIPVRLPDGKPAAGADYLVMKSRQYVQLTNGYFETRYGYTPKKLGADGVIAVRADIDDYDVIVVHDAGWAQLPKKQVEEKKEITLEPWGAVEGTVRVGSKVGSREMVALSHTEVYMGQVSYTYTAPADEEGRFHIDRVVPRNLEAGRKVTSHNMGTTTTSMTYVKVEPGKTVRATIGGTGRPVIGRVSIPEGARTRATGGWTFGNLSLPRDRLPIPAYPQDWMDMDEQQQQDWWKEHRAALQSVLERMTTPERPATFQLEPDFSFRIEDVPAGTYILEVQVAEAPSGSRLETIGTLRQKIEVPPMADGRSDEPLDLGELPLPIEKKAKIGEAAPLFEVKDVWGKPMRIADYQGKHLVLSFLWPHMGKSVVKRVQALHEQVSKSDRAAMVSIYPDRAPENVAEYFRSRQMTWPQAFVSYLEYPAGMREYEIDYPSMLFLIDPQGKIIAREKDVDAMRTALARALAGELRAPASAPADKAAATQPAAATQESTAAEKPETVVTTVKVVEQDAVITPSTQPDAGAENTPAPAAKAKTEKPALPAFTYTVPDVPAGAKVNLVFRPFPVEFSEEQCDQRIVPWLEASPRPALCKSAKALIFDVERRHAFEVRMLLDESGGTGSGYDTLYVDTNLTGDFSGAKVYKASKFTGKAGVEGGKVVAWFENITVPVGRWEGRSTAHIQVFLQEPKPGSTDAGVLEGWAIPQSWAVGTVSIGGKTYPAAMLDRNWNDKLTDNAGFRPEQYPAMLARGDYLILGETGTRTLVSGGTLGEGGSARVIRTDTIVLDSAAYQTAVAQTDEGMSLRFQPTEVATEKKRLEAASGERLVLLGRNTSVILNDPSAEAALPEDTYLALVNLQGAPVIIDARPPKMAAGMSAARFEVQALDGKPLKLEDYRGRHVVLCFWASWARPCQADLPHLKSVHERFGKTGKVEVIGLSMDDDADTTREFLESTPLPWRQCYLNDAQRAEVAGAYGVDSVPATFLIDPQGRIVAKDLRGARIEAAVAEAVGGK